MKVIFLCSSLEPGKDGVGDYCRKLAASLITAGHEATIIALNDKFLNIKKQSEKQYDGQTPIGVFRFSPFSSWVDKIKSISDIISGEKPDWISLQYVAYGFDKKGLPFYLPQKLQQLSTHCKWHIMFHETWIGISSATPLTHKLYGHFQKKIAVSLVRLLQPVIITTTNVLYQLVLKEKNIQASCIPLFSNISRHATDETFLSDTGEKYGLNLKSDQYYKLGVFGTLYPEANLHLVMPAFINKKNTVKKVVVILFGKNDRPEEVTKLKKNLKRSTIFIELGELNEQKVSSVMSILDEAILCTPVEYIGKSGAYAALRLHNVKVAVLSSSPIPKYAQDILQYNVSLSERSAEQWNVQEVSKRFIALLDEYTALKSL